MYSAVGGAPGLSATSMSASCAADVVGLHEGEVVRDAAAPMLSLMVSSSPGGTISRMRCSTRADHALGLLDARADRRAEVQAHLPGVDLRERSRADHHEQGSAAPTSEHRRAHDEHEARGGASTRRERRRVAAPGSRSKRAVAPAVEARAERRCPRRCSASCSMQHARQRGHQRAREQVRRQHRERPRDSASGVNRKRAGPVEQHHREEHDADGERRRERGHGDLLRAVEDGDGERLAHVRGCGGCSRPRPWRRRPACRWRARARRASSGSASVPVRKSPTSAARIARGMRGADDQHAPRQLPRKKRIISETSSDGDDRLAEHALDGGAHEDRLVEVELQLHPLAARPRG